MIARFIFSSQKYCSMFTEIEGLELQSRYFSWELQQSVKLFTLRMSVYDPYSVKKTHRCKWSSAEKKWFRKVVEILRCANLAASLKKNTFGNLNGAICCKKLYRA